MEFRKNGLSFAEARAIDLVNFLAENGYHPVKVRGTDLWYLSPLRQEHTPSFKVNTKINTWYDFGIGKGGTLIEFGLLHYQCSLSDLMERLAGNLSLPRPSFNPITASQHAIPSKTVVTGENPLTSGSLTHYLAMRKIPFAVAEKFCRQIYYKQYGKQFYGIGFRNDSGGYEIRNALYKTSSSPKDITTIKNGGDIICVLEGFFDFLSFLVLYPDQALSHDFVILNSLSFFEKARAVMESYQAINLYLDNDNAGRETTLYARSIDKRYNDLSIVYESHKDLNDLLCGKTIPPIAFDPENARPP